MIQLKFSILVLFTCEFLLKWECNLSPAESVPGRSGVQHLLANVCKCTCSLVTANKTHRAASNCWAFGVLLPASAFRWGCQHSLCCSPFVCGWTCWILSKWTAFERSACTLLSHWVEIAIADKIGIRGIWCAGVADAICIKRFPFQVMAFKWQIYYTSSAVVR